ncbi:MAG: glycosyltransferase family 9 protein [bacterium]
MTWIRLGRPGICFRGAGGIGDDLLCTAVLRELSRRHMGGVCMVTAHPEIFTRNRDVALVATPGARMVRKIQEFGGQFIILSYESYDVDNDLNEPPRRHIIAEMCAKAGIRGFVNLRPYLNLRADEVKDYSWAKGKIVIQSSGMASRFPMPNREWYPEQFMETVGLLAGKYDVIQIGSPRDPILPGVIDLRGKTSMRESAALFSQARLYVGAVGLLMHLARAVECPAVIIYGGREAPWQTGYSCNFNICEQLPCSPCWRRHTCDHQHECMTRITSNRVVEAIYTMLATPRSPLVVDEFFIG